MTKLAEQIDKVDREIDLLLASDETRLAIVEIELAHENLEESFGHLSEGLTQRQSLQESDEYFQFADVEESESNAWPSILTAYDLVLSVWDENTVKVRQCAAFGELVQSMEGLAKAVERNNREKWQEWVDSKARDLAISDAELESIKHVPEYQPLITEYRSGIKEFDRQVMRLPDNAESVVRVRDLADRLLQIKSEFNFSLPDYVLEFYKALDENNSFPLDKVSAKLMLWLTENNALKNLSVVRRRTSNFC